LRYENANDVVLIVFCCYQSLWVYWILSLYIDVPDSLTFGWTIADVAVLDTSLNITKLDVLDTFPTIKVAVAYLDPVTGEELASFPADLDLLGK
jgi:hypothetical protein